MTAETDGWFGALKQVDAGVLSVGYAEAGPGDGPAVILLHGWPYDIHSYADVTSLLASAGYRVIVPYLRGYGTTRFLSDATSRLRGEVRGHVRAPDHLGRRRAQPASRGPAGIRPGHH
jgi:pimeloyl-ACP methyl ester carboxylesterase